MIRQRKPNRWRKHDYSRRGYYFVTLCTKSRSHFFGEIENGVMILNEIGQIAEKCWGEIPEHVAGISLDKFVVMPNHIHGVIIIEGILPLVSKGKRSSISIGNRQACLFPIDTRPATREIAGRDGFI